MNKLMNRDNLTFTGLQAFLWSGFAAYFGFFVPYLKSNGYSEVDIGILMSALSFIGIIGPVFWGAVSDRVKSSKALLAANLLAGCAAALLIPAVIKSFGLALGVLIAVNLTVCAMPAVVDGWAMRLKSRGAEINYGLIRGAGSIAYAVTNMACGVLFTQFGLGLLFPVFFGFGAITAVIGLFVRERPPQLFTAGEAAEGNGGGAGGLFRNTAYLLFVVLAMVLYVGQSASMNFYPLLLSEAGGTNADLGLALGIMALSEFPVMFLSGRLLNKVKDTTLLLVAMGFFALRIFLFFALDTVPGLVWSQLTNSLSFGIFMPVSVHFISRITPDRLKATALSVAASAYMGVGGILGNLAGGFLIRSLGIRPMFGLAAALALAVTVVFGIVLAVSRRKPFIRELA